MTTTTKRKLRLYVSLEIDDDAESPLEHDVFTLISVFSEGSGAVASKLDELLVWGWEQGKTWWVVSCYRHGGEHWYINGGPPAGADCWDITRTAGILFIESGDPTEVGPTPEEAAVSILAEYNRWCSGDCWCIAVKVEEEVPHEGTCPCCGTPDVPWYTAETEDYESCGGFIGREHALRELGPVLESFKKKHPDDHDRYEVAISGDPDGRTYEGDVAEQVRKVGLRVIGDPEDGA
jgi:hypothetical protein